MSRSKGTSSRSARVIAPATLHGLARDALLNLGARLEDAECVAGHLVDANLAGHDSHGVRMLTYYAELIRSGAIDLRADPLVVLDHGAVIVVDGCFGFGQVVGQRATNLAIERATRHGVACVLCRNANHIGRLGHYAEQLAEAGLACILLVNLQGADQHLAPYGGVERRLTNNPIALSAPAQNGPFVVDMALTAVAEGKIWLARDRGEPIPDGWLLDSDGRPSRDPGDLDRGGTLLPLGGLEYGHKAYGLSVLVDILAGALSDGGVCREGDTRFSNAFLLLGLDVKQIVDDEQYEEKLRGLEGWVKSSRLRAGVTEIRLPGEIERASTTARREEGIPISAGELEALTGLGDVPVDLPNV